MCLCVFWMGQPADKLCCWRTEGNVSSGFYVFIYSIVWIAARYKLSELCNWWKQLVVWLRHLWTWQALTDRRPAPLIALLWASESSPTECYSVLSLWACFRWELTLFFHWETILTIFFSFRIFCSLLTVHLYAFYFFPLFKLIWLFAKKKLDNSDSLKNVDSFL